MAAVLAMKTERRSDTPVTARSTFTVTPSDVGSEAVRKGVAEQLEQERNALLIAAEVVLQRIRQAGIGIGAAQEAMLEAAVRMAKAGR